MLRRYVEQLLNVYNYIDGIVVTNKFGYIEFYKNFRPELNKLKESDVLHKHILDVYPGLTEETSSVMRVLSTGRPISNEFQVLKTYKGQSINAINTTLPIRQNDEIIGAVDVSRYIDSPFERQDIVLSIKDNVTSGNLYSVDDIITSSREMEIIKERIPMIADTDSSVLIYGETGTGKELVAQSIHTSSKRRNKRFISQNCAAIPANLLESILFGTVKGSYTGAENKPGLFEIANGGTLFLDEINSMEKSVQAKILKAIEEKQVVRLGGYEPIKTDVKIVSAINQDPIKCVEEGRIRSDLFYRLSVVQINVPPLRERQKDLFYLTDHFIKEFNKLMGREILGLVEEAESIFSAYSWPGNVRELKNVIEGAFNIASGRFIKASDLPAYIKQNVSGSHSRNLLAGDPETEMFIPGNLEEAMRNYEREIISRALQMTDSYVEAAELLGITKQNLNYKMNKLGIER
ncbi:MAG TPA: sigma 54-interacting transcriptional regulator [Candidatus Avanaerovorax faecigallinarum]|nr:sigma 54-interacting transcriptional regulator [Candidatus Avanaerovorax faecigallinarum]